MFRANVPIIRRNYCIYTYLSLCMYVHSVRGSLQRTTHINKLEYAAIALATKHINKYAGTILVISARH